MDFRFLLIWGWKSGLIGSKSSKVHHDPFQSAHWYANTVDKPFAISFSFVEYKGTLTLIPF